MVAVNLTGVFLFSQAVGRVMIRQGGGKIVNVSSTAGRTGVRGMAACAAAVFVASDQADFMTGETLYVSGGPRTGNREDPRGVSPAP
jgi:NAD(P)-dependent dehydrogenase (short-subunit alcohol dehydrogenase family)